MDKDGVVVTNQWITINGAKNYAQADGTLLKSAVAVIGGKKICLQLELCSSSQRYL